MAVKLYVSRDAEGKPWPPDRSHEVLGAQEIARQLWSRFHHLSDVYVVVANVRFPSADMLIMSELGFGIIELKHHAGKVVVDQHSGWTADGRLIEAGAGFSTPRKQVEFYAQSLKAKLSSLAPFSKWDRSGGYVIATSVCFTNPQADVTDAQARIERLPLREKGHFSVLVPNQVPSWVARLRFEETKTGQNNFAPERVKASQLTSIASVLLNGEEWHELVATMPSGAAYAFLELVDGGSGQVFALTQDEQSLGRDPDCGVVIAERFKRVSRHHAVIRRKLNQVTIEDPKSSFGTFVNGKRITVPTVLKENDQIQLGDAEPSSATCILKFVRTQRGLRGQSRTGE